MSFEVLPNEILVKIFSYLPEEDIPYLINVCTRFRELLTKICINGTLNLQKGHLLNSTDIRIFFRKDCLSSPVKTLILNGIWWFDPVRYIMKCSNLKVLHIYDIRLKTAQFKDILLSCPQIEDIEFSWPVDLTFGKVNDLKTCETVLNNIKTMKFLTAQWKPCFSFLKFTPALIKLAIIYDIYISRDSFVSGCKDFQPFGENIEPLYLVHLRDVEIICKTMSCQSFLNRIHFKLDDSTLCSTLGKSLLSPYPNLNYLFNKIVDDDDWMKDCTVMKFPMSRNLEFHLSAISFPYAEEVILFGRFEHPVTEFVSKMPKLKSFHYFAKGPTPLSLYSLHKLHPKLQKLSFRCYAHSHSLSYVLGELENFTSLEHLCVPPCVLEEKLPSLLQENPFKQMFLFKRPRLGESNNSDKAGFAAFNKVIENSPQLKILEIAFFKDNISESVCQQIPTHWQSLENIKKLSHLTHLTLELIPVTSGAFIKPIAENCDKLEFLRLRELGFSGKCVYLKELADSLPLFKNLQSFRFENNYMLPGQSLFEALSKCQKVERIAIFSKMEVYRLHEQSLAKLLQKKNLTFAYIDIHGVSSSSVIRINKEVKLKKSEYLFYHIASENYSVKSKIIPQKYSRELVEFIPWIAI